MQTFSFKRLLFIIIFSFFISSAFAQSWELSYADMINYFQAGDYENAKISGEKAVDILKDDQSKVADYLAVLNNLAFVYYELKLYDNAEASYLEVIKVVEPVLSKEHEIYARVANNLGEVYLITRQLENAKQYLEESEKIRFRLLGIKDPNYTQSLRNLTKLYIALNDYQKAEIFQDSIKSNMKTLFGENSQQYLLTLNEEGLFYLNISRYKKAAGTFLFLVNGYDDKVKDGNYLTYLRNLGFAYQGFANYVGAIDTYETLKSESEKLATKEDYALYTNELGVLYFEAGQFQEALDNYFEALEIRKKILGENSPDYAYTLNNIGVLYYNTGDYVKAEKYYLQAKSIRENAFGNDHPMYAESLNSLGALYFEEGNYGKSEDLYTEALLILETGHYTDRSIYFTVLTNLGELYEELNNRKQADIHYGKALTVGRKILGYDNLDYAKLLTKVAGFYQLYGMYNEADSVYQEAIDIQLRSVGKYHIDYANTLNSWGTMRLEQKRYKEAEKFFLQSKEIRHELFGEKNYQYTVVLLNLAALYHKIKKNKLAESYIRQSDINISDNVKNTVKYMSAQESEAFLQTNTYLFNIFLSYYYKRKEKSPKLSGDAYNSILTRKGLLLQGGKQLKRKIINSKDSNLISKYFEFIKLREEIGKLETSDQIVDKERLSFLIENSEKLDKELVDVSSDFKDQKELNNYDWRDIKKKLKKDEAIIDFIHFRYYDLEYTDSIYYCAILLRADYKYPKMIHMFEENELNKLLNKDEFINDHMYIGNLYHKTYRKEFGFKPKDDKKSHMLDSLIYGPFEKYLDDVKTLYISPSGLLHKISFSALSVNREQWLSDIYDINIFTGSKELLFSNKKEKKTENVAVYGGIAYDTDIEKLRSFSMNIPKPANKNKRIDEISYIPKDIVRGEAWTYLQGTLNEANTIEGLMNIEGANVSSYIGEEAVEETIKQFYGIKRSPDIIHIATHGFFFPDPKESQIGSLEFGHHISAFKTAENPMLRSGLLFSGANHIWQDKEIPDDIDDGILTAYEVSNLNLGNTDLVVLSACETGLGDIKGSEGVYGLQRAFKIAGTDYLIMSLWQVPDQQTVDLMTSFYKYKLSGETIPEAFRKAQNELKEKYLPFYWAAFVLIR